MPNIQTKEFSYPSYPFFEDGYEFLYATKFNKNKSLIMVRYNNKEFFLEVIKRENDFLIKAEKLTKISPVFIIQNALKALSKKLNLKLTYSNIDSKKSHQHLTTSSKYLKKIDFFIEEFKPKAPIIIEIGFGSGRHLLHKAKEDPNTTFIGIEIHKPSIEQVIKQCKLQNINNILLLDYDARIFLELLDSNIVKTIYLHFPVPWDKKPHRRVVSERFLKECYRVLTKGGTFELRTDSQNYYNYTFEIINKFNVFDLKIRKNHSLSVSSKYEDRWKKLQKDIYDMIILKDFLSKDEKKLYKIDFEDNFFIYFKNLAKDFKKTTLREKEYFVNIEEIFVLNENEGILKLTIGSYNKSEHKYIIFKDKKVKYFPVSLLPTKDNFLAHQLLKNYIKKVANV